MKNEIPAKPRGKAFQKGMPRPAGAGRKKGTPNRVTRDFREAVKLLINNLDDKLVEWVERVAERNPARAVDCVVALAEYVTPKLSRQEISTTPEVPQLVKQIFDDIPDTPIKSDVAEQPRE